MTHYEEKYTKPMYVTCRHVTLVKQSTSICRLTQNWTSTQHGFELQGQIINLFMPFNRAPERHPLFAMGEINLLQGPSTSLSTKKVNFQIIPWKAIQFEDFLDHLYTASNLPPLLYDNALWTQRKPNKNTTSFWECDVHFIDYETNGQILDEGNWNIRRKTGCTQKKVADN
jgi:hypothetical protein